MHAFVRQGSEGAMDIQLEGIVHASRYDANAPGKQFLGAAIECSDGKVWVIDYAEESPFHAFAGRQVLVAGEPFTPGPGTQHLVSWGDKPVGHFEVSTMRLAKVTPDAELVEVGPRHYLVGRLERCTSDTGGSTLSFVTEMGDVFHITNDPAGANVGRTVEVCAHRVEPSPSNETPRGQYLWIMCPCSMKDIWEWRAR